MTKADKQTISTTERLKLKHKVSLKNFDLFQDYDPEFFTNTKKERLENCFSVFDKLNTIWIKHKDTEREQEEEQEHIKAVSYCKQPFCACCANKKGVKWFWKLKPILENVDEEQQLWFITLTWPNILYNDFSSNTFKTCSKMFNDFRNKQSRVIKKLFKDCVRKTECTVNYSEYSYNLHYHLMISCDNLTKEHEELIKKTWTSVYKKYFTREFIRKDNLLVVDFKEVNRSNISNELTGYVSKSSLDSIDKNDILKSLKYKLKTEKRADKKEHWSKQIAVIEAMNQDKITAIHTKLLKETVGKNFFNICGFDKQRKAEVEKNFYNECYFDNYKIIYDFVENDQNNTIFDYFKTQFKRQKNYNKMRKVKLKHIEIVNKIVDQAPFFVEPELKLALIEYLKTC